MRVARAFLRRLLLLAVAVAMPLASARAQVDPPKIDNPFPPIPTGFDGIFGHRDSRALDILRYLQCMNVSMDAARSGLLGAVPENALVVCVQQKGEWRGVFGNLDANGDRFSVAAQYALRRGGMRTADPVDTGTVATVARAMMRGFSANRTVGRNTFTFVPLKLETYVELWFMPVQSSATQMYVGGDSVIQMTADGRREQGHMSKSPPVRIVPMPSGASFVIDSNEEQIPLISELMVAHLALARVPEVRIRTRTVESVLDGRTGKWRHVPRGR